MADDCFNFFSITAPTASITMLHEALNSAPPNGDTDGWLDALNLLLSTNPATDVRDYARYADLEDSEKRFPFGTQWNVERISDHASTLSFWCVTKNYGYESLVSAFVEMLDERYEMTRFEYFELVETDHGYWTVFTRDEHGTVRTEGERRAVRTYFNDEDEVWGDDEKPIFDAPADWDIEQHYTLTLWDDGTITDEMEVQPITLRSV